jgi:tetratricopeptide (TPR) repeat protein
VTIEGRASLTLIASAAREFRGNGHALIVASVLVSLSLVGCVVPRPASELGQANPPRSEGTGGGEFTVWKRYLDDAASALKQGRVADAESSLKSSIAAAEPFGEDDTRLALARTMLAFVYMLEQRFGEAHALARRTLPVLERNLGLDSGPAAVGLIVIGTYQLVSAQPSRAEETLRRAVRMAEQAVGPRNEMVAYALCQLSIANIKMLRPAQAEPILRRAALLAEELGDRTLMITVSIPMVALADAYARIGNLSDAVLLYRSALTLHELAVGREHEAAAPILEKYASVLRRLGRESEAQNADGRARAITDQRRPSRVPDVGGTR